MRVRNTRHGSITLPPDKAGERQELVTGEHDVPDARWEAIAQLDSVKSWLACGELEVVEAPKKPDVVFIQNVAPPPPRVPNEGTSHAMRKGRGR